MRTDNSALDQIQFEVENTSLWTFPERGNWATHNPKYRGNFAPQIPRNLILKYSSECDLVLDPMVGGGTTLIETRLLNRNAIGIDINPNAVRLSQSALQFESKGISTQSVLQGNAKMMPFIPSESVDLIVTHPPYMNIIKYSEEFIADDLSNITSPGKFCDEIELVAKELFRVLKTNKYCCILIGDTRRSKHFVPLAYSVMMRFLRVGFVLKEDIIKAQHNCSATKRWIGKAQDMGFYLIMHEHLFVFRKPAPDEDVTKVKWSRNLA